MGRVDFQDFGVLLFFLSDRLLVLLFLQDHFLHRFEEFGFLAGHQVRVVVEVVEVLQPLFELGFFFLSPLVLLDLVLFSLLAFEVSFEDDFLSLDSLFFGVDQLLECFHIRLICLRILIMNSFEESKLQDDQTAGTHGTNFGFEEADGRIEEGDKEGADNRHEEEFSFEDGEYVSSLLPDHTLHLGSLIPVWKSSKAKGGHRFFIGPDCSLS